MRDPLLDLLPDAAGDTDPLLATLPDAQPTVVAPPMTAADAARPSLDGYQPPARQAGASGTWGAPGASGSFGDPLPPKPSLENYQPPVGNLLAEQRPGQRLQEAGDRVQPGPIEYGAGFVKGAAGAMSMGAYQPNIARTEQEGAFAGNVAGGMAPLALSAIPGAAPLMIPAMVAQQGLPATAAQVNPATGQPADPVKAAVGVGFAAAMAALPPAFGQSIAARVGSGAGMGELQSVVMQAIDAKARGGDLDLSNPEAVKDQITQVLFGMAFGMAHGGAARPDAARGAELPVAEVPSARTDARNQAWSEARGQGAPQGPDPLLQAIPDAPAAQAPVAGVPERRGIYEAAPVPEDMQGRQWMAGNEAATAARSAEMQREQVMARHESAVRAAIESENALRDVFPDEGAPMQFPAQRDQHRELSTRYQDSERALAESRAELDRMNSTLAEANKKASQVKPTEVPRGIPEEGLQARSGLVKALKEAGLPDAQIELAVRVADRNPEFYGRIEHVAADTPELLKTLFGEQLPGKKLEIGKEAHQLSFELDFGEGSPYAKEYPGFGDMPYEQKARVTKQVLDRVVKVAQHLSGVKEGITFYGPGGWGEFPIQPSGQVRVDAPIEKVRHLADAIGYLAQQTGVYISRPHAGGQKVGIDIRAEGLSDPKTAKAFWEALRAEAPELASGFHPVEGGIRIGRDESPAQIAELEAKFGPAIQRVAEKMGLDTVSDFVKLESELRSNNWKEAPDGREYIQRLSTGLGPEIQGRLDRQYRPAIENTIRGELAGGRGKPLLQEGLESAAHGGPERAGGSGLRDRFRIDPEALAANSPEAAKSVYRALGNKVSDKNTSADLKIYPLNDLPADAIPKWLEREGWNYKIFGPDQETGKFVPPNFKDFSYDNKHVWIFSPWTEHGSFRDTEYTRTWRVTHEVAHGQTNEQLTQKYGGAGRRQGALGRATKFNGRDIPPLALADAMRAVEWEHDTFLRQREILEKDFGIKITDEQFRKENAINLSDAVYRVLTGDFSNPGELGFEPRAMSPDQLLSRAKDILRTAAKDMGLDMAETFGTKKPEALLQANSGRDIKGAFLENDKSYQGFIYLVKGKADISTFLHEHGHAVLENVLRENPQHKADLATVEKWITSVDGAEAIKAGEWTTTAKETFARGVERYFYDGKTDIPELKPVFERIRAWMKQIYKWLVESPIAREIPEEVRQVMDRLLGHKAEKKGEPTPRGRSDSSPLSRAEANDARVSVPPEVKSAPAKSQVPGERSLPKTLEENGLPGGTSREYTPKSNAQTMAKASAELDKKGLDKAAQEILAKDKPSAEQTAKAITIMRRWQHEADGMPDGAEKEALLEKTVGLATEMSKRLTNLGQAIQAVRIIESLSPDGVLFYAQRKINNLNEHRPESKQLPPLTPAKANELRAAAKDLQTETAFSEEAKTIANIADKMGGKKALPDEDLAALKAFRDRMVEYLGDKPQRIQKGVMAPRPRTPKQDIESITSMLESREKAAMDRLAAKGFQPTKALFQAKAKLGDAEIEDLADIFASRLSKRGDKSVAAIKQSFKDSFGPEIAPHMDRVAQRGAQKLSRARGERAKLAALVGRVDEILAPLVESGKPALAGEAERLRDALFALRDLTGDARVEAGQDLQAALQELAPASLGQKVSSVQTIAQLLNPKTLARNVIGNEMFYRLERLSKWTATPIDFAASKLTGERTLSFRTEGQQGYWKAFMTGAKAAAKGVSPGGLESQYDLQAPSFRGKHNPFKYLERALGVVLRATDFAAYTRAKNETLGELASLAADKVGVPDGSRKQFIDNWIRNADDRVGEIADSYGKYATFQDDTYLSRAASAFKKGANVATYLGTVKDPRWGLGDLILKYPKTPANIFMRAMDYSPAGFARSAYLLAEPILNGNVRNQREMSMALGRALVGSLGMTGMAYYLAGQGILSGRVEKDKDAREFMQNETGQRNFQVNVSALSRWVNSGFEEKKLGRQEGDRLMSYDWMQPMAINLAMATTANAAIGNKKKPVESALGMAEAGGMAGVQALQDQPFMQGITQLVGDKNSNIAEKLAAVLEGAPASFVPTIVNQVKQVMDNTKRETRAPTMLQRTLNKVVAKIPFFSETLPAAYKTVSPDPKEMYQDGTNSLWNVFVNPAFISKYHLDPQLAAIIGPYEAEGRTQQFPFVAPKKLQYTEGRDKKSIELSGEEYAALQRSIAQNTVRAFQGIDYTALAAKSAEHQEKEMGDRVRKAWERSRVEFLRDKGIHFKN